MTPEEVAAKFKAVICRAEDLQKQSADAAQKAGQVLSVLNTTEDYWVRLAAQSGANSAAAGVLNSGVATIGQLEVSLNAIQNNDSTLRQLNTASLSANLFASNTVATYSVLPLEGKYEFKVNAVPVPNYYGETGLAERFEKIDPALAKVCREIWQALFGTNADPVRAALYMLRQTYDHFFGDLAPDEKVRASPYWKEKAGPKPELVTREERLRYAVETHVKDPTKRALLSTEFTQMTELYQKLNQAHKRGEIDEKKAREYLNSMFAYLETWADALGI